MKRQIAVYGKGGAGKSTVSGNLAVLFARDGHRVLLVGCDPKADTSHLHVDVDRVVTVMPDFAALATAEAAGPEAVRSFILPGRNGVDCLEAGGPEPGRGCAGLGISTTLKLLDHSTAGAAYDVVIYDVLGDVVCGGFSVPLRSGRAREVYIVVSGDVSSLYAANNIARAVATNRLSGARLAGIVLNRARPDMAIPEEAVREFAARLGTRVAAVLPLDPRVTAAEARGGTVSEMDPGSDAAAACEALYRAVLQDDAGRLDPPTPLENPEVLRFLRDRRRAPGD